MNIGCENARCRRCRIRDLLATISCNVRIDDEYVVVVVYL